LLSTD